jgi:hypothetical protein
MKSTNAGQVVSDTYSAPTDFITSMTCMVMMTVINRKEIIIFIKKLHTNDDIILEGKGFKIDVKNRRRMLLELIIVIGVLIPLICYDSYLFGQLLT